MNVLLVGDGDAKYGASHSLLQMATALHNTCGVCITVALNQESAIAQELRENGCGVYIIKYTPFYQNYPEKSWKLPIKYVIRGMQYFLGRVVSIRTARKMMRENQFDLIHSNSSREDFSEALAEKYKIPLVWHIREFGDRDFKCYSYRNDYIQLMNKASTQIIAVSDSVRAHWISKGIEERKVVTVYNGVLSTNYIDKQSSEHHDSVNMVIVGSLSETKGQLQAVEAVIQANHMQNNQVFTLDIIGDGDTGYKKRIIKTIEKNNMTGQIRILGYKRDVPSLLASYDVGLVCSRDEAFGRVTAEYMMAGLPVIASDTGANKELIREGKEGLFYSYGNTSDLAEKVLSIGNHIGEYRRGQIHTYAVENFSSDVNAHNIYAIYKEIVEG